MMEKVVAPLSHYKKILKDFPRNMMFCFAYGSGAFKQKIDPSRNMLDLIFVVRNSDKWHAENIRRNPRHYAQPLRFIGHRAITNFQETLAAKIYYNTLVRSNDGRLIKYGVISEISLIEDLLDWNSLYIAGRLHKPVQILVEPDENSKIGDALVRNLNFAIHSALLLLPERFTELELYKCVAGLSYNGDFRMIFGEDKNKIANIVVPQFESFRDLYTPILSNFERYIDIDGATNCHQDTSPAARIHHLNNLPRKPQIELVRAWSHGPRSKDTEDCLRAIAHDPDCGELLARSLREIVWRSSVSQSLKGIVTAGLVKSMRYGWAKIAKMAMSEREEAKSGVVELTAKSQEKPMKNREISDTARKENIGKEVSK